MEIKVVRQILEWNENVSDEVEKKLKDKNVYMINIMGSPGAGKTTFIINLIHELKKKNIRPAVIEGDIEGTIDAKKIQDENVPVVQLNTQGACHIEAMSISNILDYFDLDSIDVLIVENIGNLVCPAEFDIGENLKIALLSIPEGDDKVVKYPLMFIKSQAVVLTKYDMINYFQFNEEMLEKELHLRNRETALFKVNSMKESELKVFISWFLEKYNIWRKH